MNWKLLFVVITLLFVYPSIVHAGEGSTGCGVRCEASKHPQAAKPAVPDETCIYFVQPAETTVVLTLTPKEGGKPRTYSRLKGPSDSFCIHRSWIAQSNKVNLCNNKTGGADYVGADLDALAVKPQFSRTLVACLYGKAACAAKGYKVEQ